MVTGAGGQLGRALADEFARRRRRRADPVGLGRDAAAPARARGAGRSSCTRPPGRTSTAPRRIRRARPPSTSAAPRTPPRSALRSSTTRPTTSSTASKREPYLESDGPNPRSAYGRSKLHGEAAAGEKAWIVRSSWLFGPTGHNFLRTMLRLGAERDEVAVVDDQRGSPTFVGHLAAATRRCCGSPYGVYHVAAGGRLHVGRLRGGDLRRGGAGLPRAPDLDRRARPSRASARVLGAAEREGAPRSCPHWREGLRECLASVRAGATRE